MKKRPFWTLMRIQNILHTIKLLIILIIIGVITGSVLYTIKEANYELIVRFWGVLQLFSLSLQEAFDLLAGIEVGLIVLWLTLYCNIPRSKYGTLDENLIKHPHEQHPD